MSDWQPIKAAPRNGTHILFCVKLNRIFVGYWSQNDRVWWCFPGSGIGYDDDEVYAWMPLPQPPD